MPANRRAPARPQKNAAKPPVPTVKGFREYFESREALSEIAKVEFLRLAFGLPAELTPAEVLSKAEWLAEVEDEFQQAIANIKDEAHRLALAERRRLLVAAGFSDEEIGDGESSLDCSPTDDRRHAYKMALESFEAYGRRALTAMCGYLDEWAEFEAPLARHRREREPQEDDWISPSLDPADWATNIYAHWISLGREAIAEDANWANTRRKLRKLFDLTITIAPLLPSEAQEHCSALQSAFDEAETHGGVSLDRTRAWVASAAPDWIEYAFEAWRRFNLNRSDIAPRDRPTPPPAMNQGTTAGAEACTRDKTAGDSSARFLGLEIDLESWRICMPGTAIDFAFKGKETLWRLFVCLFDAKGRLITNRSIITAVWGDDESSFTEEATLLSRISDLRSILAPFGISIVNERKKGYRLIGSAEIAPE